MRGPATSRHLGDPPPEGFVELEAKSHFAGMTGPFYASRPADGSLVLGFRVAEKHLNRVSIVHGGMLATFMDMLLSSAMEHASGRRGFTVRLVTDFVGPAKLGDWIEGRGRLVRMTRSLAFLEGELQAGRRKIMGGSGIFALMRAKE
ncbi:MAG: PaaI family thioesterase [Alphaproteobacteria bacterium]|nr:PaaI family thioesterase [Alphaproteobacteria bacterium]